MKEKEEELEHMEALQQALVAEECKGKRRWRTWAREGGEEEGRNEKKEKGAKEGKRKTPGWSWWWKEEERKVKDGASERREEEAGAFSPCLNPNS